MIEPDRIFLGACDDTLTIEVELERAMNYALAHNGVSPLKRLVVENRSREPIEDLVLEMRLDAPTSPSPAAPLRLQLPAVLPESEGSFDARPAAWPFSPIAFAQIDEAVSATVTARVVGSGHVLEADGAMSLLAHDEWWALSIPESLAAFVTPRAPAVRDLLGEASALLQQRTKDPSLQGYQANVERVVQITRAIYDAMAAREIRYINPPASFEGTGQKIRSPDEVLMRRWGTCLDLATSYAAALEGAGLNPVLFMCHGHAFAGVLTEDQQLPVQVLADRPMVMNYVESGLLIPVETTMVCQGEDRPGTFDAAVAATRQSLDTILRHALDVRAAHRLVRPLPAISTDGGVRVVEIEREPPAPVIPTATMATAGATTSEESAPRGALAPRETYPPRVARWRNSLLDLSLRNPLLNMRSGRGALELHVPSGALGSIEDRLFAGDAYRLIPHDQLAEIHLERGARTAADIDADELRRILADGDLFVACTEAAYLTRLRGLVRRARTIQEETGANNLFLTLGILEWQENGRPARAPLFMLPVNVVGRRGRPFTLHIEDGASARPNHCLVEKLRVSHGLEIPQLSEPEADESGIDVPGSIRAIRRALIDQELPFAVEESARVGLLQFSTMQMWQDLSNNWSTFMCNPVVRHLVETPTDSFLDPAADHDTPSDPEATSWCPIPIDGYQLEAVSAAEAGRSFVLEGPPGTGKSQTITNLIANAIAAGKTVLFVAEKQAALDVVQRRLAKVGLRDLCLNLHGRTQSPEDVRGQLRHALRLTADTNVDAWETLRADYRGMVAALSRYPRSLHEAGGAGLSAWQAQQTLLGDWDGPTVTVPETVVSRPLDTDALYRTARELTQAAYDLGVRQAAHPWRMASLRPDALADSRTSIMERVTALSQAMASFSDGPLGDIASALAGSDALTALGRWADRVGGSDWAVELVITDPLSADEWHARSEALSTAVAALARDAAPLMEKFQPTVVSAVALDELRERAQAADRKMFKGKARRQVVDQLAGVLNDGVALEPGTIAATLDQLVALRDRVVELTNDANTLPGLHLEDSWNPLDTTQSVRFQASLDAIRATIALERDHPQVTPPLAKLVGLTVSEADAQGVRALSDAWEELANAIVARPELIEDWRESRPLVEAIRAELPAWVDDSNRGLVALARWSEVQEHSQRLRETGLGELVDRVADGTVPVDDIESVLRRGVAEAVLRERLSGPVLSGFDGVAQDRAAGRFGRAGAELRQEMVTELPAHVVRGRSFSADRLVGRVGALARELSRKRGGLKVRELFESYGPIIGELTPCLMMSPASVAQFLPPDALQIDIAVFDEASQIRVAEAVGAMGRAASTVVVGDSKQMPPSDIAVAGTGEDEETPAEREAGIPADMESVLSEAVESNLPRRWLSWHYRSQHESLIAFSNEQYYENRLASFPTPPGTLEGVGVSWKRLQGVFERGGARVNRVEAEAIVAALRERFAVNERASVGVVTFNLQQRDLILDLLEESGDERISAALADEAEPLFVKNLENVQGDERDVILFSLAFSPQPETGRLPLNFGPLSRSGGERRLNVAVTRARAEVIVYASFDPEHIDVSRTSSVGLAHLRGYLEMARRRDGETATMRPAPARDRHLDDVVAALRQAGLHVQERLGLSEFTVDIAVAESPVGPWTAVFLDGPAYAARHSVADRETLPYEVLRGSMGWAATHRIWLPDWVRNRAEAVARVRHVVAQARQPVVAETQPRREPQPTNPVRPPSPAISHDLSVASSDGHATEGVAVLGATPAISTESIAKLRNGTIPPGADAFVAAHVEPRGTIDVLDTLPSSPASQSLVRAQLEEVLAQEAPVAAGRLTRVVARRFGLQRVAAKRAQEILELVPTTQRQSTVSGVFVWAADQVPDAYETFRIPTGAPERVLEEISPRELANGMRYLARTGGGILREELLRETNNLFGYGRMAAKSRGLLETALDEALRLGMLVQESDAIAAGD